MASQKALAANRFPYPKEEAVLRAHVAGAEEERLLLERRRHESQLVVESAKRDVETAERVLEAAREALESAQILHDGITESCRALDARVAVARIRLHPIRRLPDDVLCEIFQFLVEGLNENNIREALPARKAPFAVSQVCRRWRTAALALPRLWSYVNLDMDDVGSSLQGLDPDAAADPAHSCKWCHFLQLHLHRSRSTHLCLRLIARDGLYVPQTSHIWARLASASPRVHTLDIEYGGAESDRLDMFLETNMPVLEFARINGTSSDIPPDPQPLVMGFFLQAPRLRHCLMRQCRIVWAQETQVFPALTSFEFVGGSSGLTVTFVELHDLLSRFPGLKRVTIDLAHFCNEPAPPSSYPLVTDVTIAVRHHNSNDLTNCFVFPSAERLNLLLGPDQASRTMIAACASTLTSVVIHERTINAAFASSLTAAVSLKGIDLVHCKLHECFFVRMGTPAASEDGALPCPLLGKLHLIDSNVPDQDAFKGDGLLRLVRLRNEETAKGARLTRLSDIMITWSAKTKVTMMDGFEQQLQDLLK